MHSKSEIAVFGGGCFWCAEAIFEQLRGIISVKSGYSGGTVPNPTYEQVCSGTTGHIEVVQVEYDPSQIFFESLLEIFFSTHDPTTMDRQGNDVGEQYRSVVFYTTEEQRAEAEKFIEKLELEGVFDNPVVTELRPFHKFYEAERYHQEYYRNNPNQPYCRAVINPKLKKFKEKYASLIKSDA